MVSGDTPESPPPDDAAPTKKKRKTEKDEVKASPKKRAKGKAKAKAAQAKQEEPSADLKDHGAKNVEESSTLCRSAQNPRRAFAGEALRKQGCQQTPLTGLLRVCFCWLRFRRSTTAASVR